MPPPEDGVPAGPGGRGHLRASHLDREHVVGMLKAAFVHGRLTKGEFDARVARALTARTCAELAALTADLPAALIASPPLGGSLPAPAGPARRKLAKPGLGWTTTTAAASGLLAGIVAAGLYPPIFTSSAMVLTSSRYTPVTQMAVARSAPVMAGALSRLGSGGSVEALRDRVQVKSLTPTVLSVSAQGDTAIQAERAADAVVDSFVAYTRSITPPGQMPAQVLDPAPGGTETPRSTRLFAFGGLGALLGALIGVISRQAFRRSGRRFRFQ